MVTIRNRGYWGARSPRYKTAIDVPVNENWLHHTAGSEAGVTGMRRIQNYHMDTKGWSDIGYSWVYDKDERTWYEGRGWGISGAHTYGHNSVSHGFCVMGNFNNERVTDQMVTDIAWMVARGYNLGKGPAKLNGGHRDVGNTSCPGNHLYSRIDDINAEVKNMVSKDNKYEKTSNKYFQPAWNWMIDNGVFSEHTDPSDVLTAEKFAVFFKRAVDKGVI